MKALGFCLTLASFATLAACSGDNNPISAPKAPLAYTRFVDAVPDTGGMDWRFVDVIENSPIGLNINFRGTFPGAGYQATGPGSRHLRIFQSGAPSDPDPSKSTIAVVSKVLFDTTFNFVAGTHYTLVVAGSMRANAAKLYIIADNWTDPGSSFGLRVFNAGVGAGAVDVYGTPDTASAIPSAALVSGLAAFSASNYVSSATGPFALQVFAAGTSTRPGMIDLFAPAGLPSNQSLDLTAVGGSTQPGSVLTAFLVPPSVTGSLAAKFTSPGIIYVVDKYPPSGF
jgi:hypothetical protein